MYQRFTNRDVRLKKPVSIDIHDSEHNFAITFFINQKPKNYEKTYCIHLIAYARIFGNRYYIGSNLKRRCKNNSYYNS